MPFIFFPTNIYWTSTTREALKARDIVGHKIDMNFPIMETRIFLRFFKRNIQTLLWFHYHNFTREGWIFGLLYQLVDKLTFHILGFAPSQWQTSHCSNLHISKNTENRWAQFTYAFLSPLNFFITVKYVIQRTICKHGILSDLIVLENETHAKFGNSILNRKNIPKMW